jgi:hypothetical protein
MRVVGFVASRLLRIARRRAARASGRPS